MALEKLRTTATTTLFLGTLLALVIHSGVRARNQFSTRTLQQRWHQALASPDDRLATALDGDYALYLAVAEGTPTEALIAIPMAMTRETWLRRTRLQSVLFPRQIQYLHWVSSLLAFQHADLKTPFFVLNPHPTKRFVFQERCAEVQASREYALWTCRDAIP